MTESELWSQLLTVIPQEKLNSLRETVEMLEAIKKEMFGVPTPQTARRVEVERPSLPIQQPVVQPVVAAPKQEPTQPAATPQPTTQLKTELPKKAPFADSVRQQARAQLVRDIWEQGLRKELVDRIIALREAGVYPQDVSEAIRKAKIDYQTFVETNGAKGVKASWIALGRWCKEQYAAFGVEWAKCSPELEPKPEPLKPVAEIMYTDMDGKNVVFHTRAISPEQAQQISDELYDGRYALQDVKDRIARYCA